MDSGISLKDASDIVLTKFECPKDQSEAHKAKRAGYGQDIYNKMGGAGIGRRNYAPKSVNKVIMGGRGSVVGNEFSNSSAAYNTATRADNYITSSNSSSAQEILLNCVKILAQIAANTGDSAKKLDLLKNISSGGSNLTANSNTVKNEKTLSNSRDLSSKSADQTALKIAQGGY